MATMTSKKKVRSNDAKTKIRMELSAVANEQTNLCGGFETKFDFD
jgi:hypothetical protein